MSEEPDFEIDITTRGFTEEESPLTTREINLRRGAVNKLLQKRYYVYAHERLKEPA